MTQAEAQIGECYPVDADGAVPVTYLWAKTIHCPHCGGEMPLIKRRWLQVGEGREPVAYELKVDPAAKTYTVAILRGETAKQSQPDEGTMRGATVACIYCGTPSERERIVEQAQAGQMGQHLLAVVLYREGTSGRDYRAATAADRAAYVKAQEKLAAARPRVTTSGASSGCCRWCPTSRRPTSGRAASASGSTASPSGARCSTNGRHWP